MDIDSKGMQLYIKVGNRLLDIQLLIEGLHHGARFKNLVELLREDLVLPL